MKVKEIIAKLQKADPEMEVIVEGNMWYFPIDDIPWGIVEDPNTGERVIAIPMEFDVHLEYDSKEWVQNADGNHRPNPTHSI